MVFSLTRQINLIPYVSDEIREKVGILCLLKTIEDVNE